MKKVIVDYAKLTSEILTLLVEKFPDGYDESDIIRFKNAKNETVEAVEVRTEDTIYLVKVSTKLADRIENFDEEDELISAETAKIKNLKIEAEEEEEEDDDIADSEEEEEDDDE